MQDSLASMPGDKMLRLREAAAALSPEGYVKVSTLRLEIARSRLTAMRIGKSYYVTPASLMEYKKKCLVSPKGHVSGSSGPATPMGNPSAPEVGLSGMDQKSIALASLKKLGQKLTSN